MRKKSLKLCLLVLVGLLLLGPVLIQAVEYPDLPGTKAPTGTSTFSQYIVYGFNLALWVGVLIAAGTLLYGGFLFITSAGNINQMNKGKQRMFYAGMGLLILFSSFLILRTISPQFVKLPWEVPPTGTTTPPVTPTTTPPGPTQYQEIPIGILTENLLAKNIDCYQEDNGIDYDKMIDCQDYKPIENGHYEVYDRKGYCYEFDQDDSPGDFIDANPDTSEIDPMTERDRLECIIKLRKAVEPRIQKLKELAQELQELTEQCDCSNCEDVGRCKPGTCVPYSSDCHSDPGRCKCVKQGTNQECKQKGSAECCLGKPRAEQGHKDPCPPDIRDKIDALRHDALKREYTDQELKEMSVDDFQDLVDDGQEGFQGDRRENQDQILVADQLRYFLVNFLGPLKKDLENDLHYLRKAEDLVENECPYQSVVNHAKFFAFKERGQNLEKIKFCKTNSGASWGESCSDRDQVEITKYCNEFNCEDCKTKDEGKLPCDECNLDRLNKGDCATTTVGARPERTCKCSQFLLNNQNGTSTCTTTDSRCIMCKIEDENPGDQEEQDCYKFDDGPATFYCPDPEAEEIPRPEILTGRKCTVGPEPKHRYPEGQIPIGEAVDRTELLAKRILDQIKKINQAIKDATQAVYDPTKPDDKTKQPDVLHFLPEGCMCNPNPDPIWNVTHCSKELRNTSCPCCHTHEECDDEGNCTDVCDAWACECGDCYCENAPHPCPMNKIREKVNVIKDANQTIPKSFDRIYDLIKEENLKSDDPRRTELINKLTNSREKLKQCVTGFEKVPKPKMTLKRLVNCSEAWDLLNLNELIILPDFPIYRFENCYPYNSDVLNSGQKQECLENKDGDRCRSYIEGIGENGGMNNYFCCESEAK